MSNYLLAAEDIQTVVESARVYNMSGALDEQIAYVTQELGYVFD